MSTLAVSCLGWVATALFIASYFFSRPGCAADNPDPGALLWVTYGRSVANALAIAAVAWGDTSGPPDQDGGLTAR